MHSIDPGEGLTHPPSGSCLRTAAGLLALQALPRVGPATALRLAMHGSSSKRGLLEHVADMWPEALRRATEQVAHHEEAGVRVVTLFDDAFPARLRELADPPPILYVKGNLELLHAPKLIAIVGTREPTVFGVTATEQLGGALARERWGVVSGLAKGIDTIAHRTALAHDAPTIAVMGGGLDRIYPSENKHLASEILSSGGTLISELPFGSSPRPGNLIARDRLQSGLSAAVVVAQCGLKSGTMHTARFAASQGRPVFCPVPHGDAQASEGLRALLERPARELCTILPAWRTAHSLCARLGDTPLAHPVRRDALANFVREVELAEHWPHMNRDQASLLQPALGV